MTQEQFVKAAAEFLGDLPADIAESEDREMSELDVVLEMSERGHPQWRRWAEVQRELRSGARTELTETERATALRILAQPL